MKPVTPFDNFPEFANAGTKTAPDSAKYAAGFVPADTLPAEWANYFFAGATKGVSALNSAVYSIWNELSAILTEYGITPSAAQTDQLLSVLAKLSPRFCRCDSPESQAVKSVAIEGDQLRAGNVYVVTMESGNTYGDGSETYPALSVNGGEARPLCDASGRYLGSGAWKAGDIVTLMFTGSVYLMATRRDDNKLTNEYIIESNGGVMARTPRWLRFSPANRKGLVIRAGTIIGVGGSYWSADSDVAVDLSEYLTSPGRDYFVYISVDRSSRTEAWSFSAGEGRTADTTSARCIGRLHTLCASVPSGTTMTAPAAPQSGLSVGDGYLVKPYRQQEDADFASFYGKTVTAISTGTYYDVVTCAHPLAGFQAGDILPESVFCLSFFPDTLHEDAMVYEAETGVCVDVYLQSGKGAGTRSRYNAVHTVTRPQICHEADMLAVGKRLLSDEEFQAAALGSNERTSISGSANASTVGGHSDTAGRRMVSAIGCEEMCGYLWQWLRDVSALGTGTAFSNIDGQDKPVGNSGWITIDGQNAFGQMYNCTSALLAGGYWGDGSHCGSRCRCANCARSRVDAIYGGRGSSRVARRHS